MTSTLRSLALIIGQSTSLRSPWSPVSICCAPELAAQFTKISLQVEIVQSSLSIVDVDYHKYQEDGQELCRDSRRTLFESIESAVIERPEPVQKI